MDVKSLDRHEPKTVENILIISEDSGLLKQVNFGQAQVKRCLIADAHVDSETYDVVLKKKNLDYTSLLKTITADKIDCILFMPSSQNIESSSYEKIEEHLKWEVQKTHQWIRFLIDRLIEKEVRVVFLCCEQKNKIDIFQKILSKYFSFLRAECPEFRISTIRIDRLNKKVLDQVYLEINDENTEPEVQIDTHKRLVPRLTSQPLEPSLVSLNTSGCMVITGGFGGIGLTVLSWFIEKGCSEFIVMGRKLAASTLKHSSLDGPTTIESFIRRQKDNGTTIHYIQGDIQQSHQVERTFEAVRKKLKKSIIRVFHLAGITTESIPLNKMSEDILTRVVRPKLYGAHVLHKITNKDPLGYFCLFSSISSVEGMQGAGLSAYAAANASIDALAELRQQQNKPVQLIHWTDWSGEGMAIEYDHKAFFDAVGLYMVNPAPWPLLFRPGGPKKSRWWYTNVHEAFWQKACSRPTPGPADESYSFSPRIHQ
ncbi:MAG: SDR family NAD(P)-dependent oxidoreductase [Kiritimatiellae bacterium]|nr:SDR family NAD(P)-dependent oxidoreductase [Kiritimatiellia bacterium]